MPTTTSQATALDRLDDFRREERCAQDSIAEVISLHLYQKSYDELPGQLRAKVEGAALHALRAPQLEWAHEASLRAYRAMDTAMASEMGLPYATQSKERRSVLALIGATAVKAALLSVFELDNPFEGPGSALRIYDAAAQQAREVK